MRLQLSLLDVIATLFQLAALLLIAGLGGNLLSILVPYRIQPGSMKPADARPGDVDDVSLPLLFPAVMAPVFVPPLAGLLWRLAGWPAVMPVNLILSILLAALAAVAYRQTLGPLGRLLQRRETKILGVVTVEVE